MYVMNPSAPRQRQAWLAAVALLHLAVFMAWRPTLLRVHAAHKEGELVFLTLPVAPPAHPAVPKPVPPPAPAPARPVRASQPVAAAPAPQAITVTPVDVTPVDAASRDPAAPDLFALPATIPDNVLDKSRSAVAKIDKQLRKESLNKYAVIINNETELARKIGAAFVGDRGMQITDEVLPDGTRLSRVRRGRAEYCVYIDYKGESGNKRTRTVNCPR